MMCPLGGHLWFGIVSFWGNRSTFPSQLVKCWGFLGREQYEALFDHIIPDMSFGVHMLESNASVPERVHPLIEGYGKLSVSHANLALKSLGLVH